MSRTKLKNKINVKNVTYDWIVKNCNKDDIMSCPETAAYTGLSLTNIYKKIEYDQIPCLKIQDMAGKIIFLKSEVDKILPKIQITKKYQTNPNPRDAAAVIRNEMQIDKINLSNYKSFNAPVKINVDNKSNKKLFDQFLDHYKNYYKNKGTFRGFKWMFNKILKHLSETNQIEDDITKDVLMSLMDTDYIKNTGSPSTRRNAENVMKRFLEFKSLRIKNPLLTKDDIFKNYGYKNHEKYKIYKAIKENKFGQETFIKPYGKSNLQPAYYKDAVEDFLTSPNIETRFKPDIFKTKEELEQTQVVSNYCKSRKKINYKYQSKIYAIRSLITDIQIKDSDYLAKRAGVKKYYLLYIYLEPLKTKYSRIKKLPSFKIALHDTMQENETLTSILKAVNSNVLFTTNIDFIKEKLLNKKMIIHYYKHKKRKRETIKYLNFYNINDTEKLNIPNNQSVICIQEKNEDDQNNENQLPPINNTIIKPVSNDENINNNFVHEDDIFKLEKEIELYQRNNYNKDQKISDLLTTLNTVNMRFGLIREHFTEIYRNFYHLKNTINRELNKIKNEE